MELHQSWGGSDRCGGAALRNPFVDGVRFVAVVGVVLGHWLVTAFVQGGDGLSVDSPLRWMPGLVPLTWVLQTLGLFFFVGGFASARSETPWWVRLRQLVVPVVVLLGCWVLVFAGLAVRGISQQTVMAVGYIVTTPLWFLGVYVVLLALRPVVRWLDQYSWGVLVPVVLVFFVPYAVWWAAWQLGYALARKRIPGPPLLVGGVVAYLLLVRFGGFPVSAVGIPGAALSNLSPPTFAALALAFAQIGLVLTIAPVLTRLGESSTSRWVNARALPIFLVHQSALVAVSLLVRAPGLSSPPDHPGWVWQRLAWLPVFALVAWGCLPAARWRSWRRAAPRSVPSAPAPAAAERTPVP
ncbi:acyltransferase family protein [Lentzea sp. NBRC 105346]|uniref:acyltransferase family protein n=1 Tax=Lentzea sp. NBRC 105346 TaxID=3032205 RepID=UPI0033211EEE